MTAVSCRRLVPVCFVFAFLAAQGAEAPPPDPAPSAQTAGDPAVALDELKLRVKPLTKKELMAEANAWLGLVQAKAKEMIDTQIQAKRAEGDAKTQLLEKATSLSDERTALVDRVKVILDSLAAKGGEVEEYEKYIAAASGMPAIDVTDAAGTWTVVVGWLKSPEGGLRWAKNIVFFLLTLLAFKILASLAAGVVRRTLSSARVKVSDLLGDFFVNSVRKLVFFIGVIVALSMIEINIGPFLAALGVAGFVIGFALQGTLSNFAAGLMILLYRPYDIGQVITAAGVTGKVTAMTLVSTILTTPDNQVVTIPNGSIWGGVITNITGNDTRRVDLTFGISYADDIAKAQAILEDIVGRHELVLKDPEPVVKLHELADSSVNFVCRPWSNTSDYWTVYWDITRSVKERFDAEGISIPFPQRDVHLHQA